MKKSLKKKYSAIAIAAIFTISSVSAIQYSLWLVHHTSIFVHWLVILFAIPFLNGILASVLFPSGANAVAFFSSFISAFILFLFYRFWFWHSPPSVLAGTILFVNLTFFSAFGVMAYKNWVALFLGKRHRRRKKTNILVYLYHTLAIVSAIVTILGYFFRK